MTLKKHMGAEVNEGRKRENGELREEGIDEVVGKKYMWLYEERNVRAKHEGRLEEREELNVEKAREWEMEECVEVEWNYDGRGWETKFYAQWFFWETRSRLERVIDVAYVIERHLYGVLNDFSAVRITNAAAEGLNSKIQTIKKMAYGYRNHFTFGLGHQGTWPVVSRLRASMVASAWAQARR